MIATTNSVNLTDGLDGLATTTSIVYFIAIAVITVLGISNASFYGQSIIVAEYKDLLIVEVALIGSLLGFLWQNGAPAKIFMGDTGSLALGGAVGIIVIFLSNPILIVIIGCMFVVSSISVIIQVMYFKITGGSRVFIMAPYHHHLEYKGHKEGKIVIYYMIITIVLSIIGVASVVY